MLLSGIYLRDMQMSAHTTWIQIVITVLFVESEQLPFHRCIVRQTVVQPHHGALHSNEKEQTIDTCNSLDGSQG